MSERDYLRRDFGGPRRSAFWSTLPATKALLIGLAAIHALLLLLRAVAPEAWSDVFGFLALQPDDVLRKLRLWQVVTGALLHSPTSILHLLFNCIAIWFFGSMIEQRVGSRRYLLFALCAALAASLGYLLFAILGSRVFPMVGASGAAMGMIVLAALWYPSTPILFMFFLPMPLWIAALVWVGLDLIGMLSIDSNIAHAAHLGGALYGWIYHRTNGGVERLLGAVDRFSERRRQERERRRGREDEELRGRVDDILDKVNREGLGSLSDDERRFLKKAGERLRR